jgi:hypothetical protein
MSGLIAVPCRPDHARHVDFFRNIFSLQIPEEWKIQLYPGFFAHDNRTGATREAIELGLDHIFFVDDDQLLRPDAIIRLLEHNVDIISCNLLAKAPPFQPYIFFATDKDGAGYPDTLDDNRTGLIEVAACGLGGVLVKTEVFKRIREPWFSVNDALKTDDLYFCHEARKAGYKIYCDLDVPSGHICNSSIWPEYDVENKKWRTAIVINNRAAFNIPKAVPTEEYRNWRDQTIEAMKCEIMSR